MRVIKKRYREVLTDHLSMASIVEGVVPIDGSQPGHSMVAFVFVWMEGEEIWVGDDPVRAFPGGHTCAFGRSGQLA